MSLIREIAEIKKDGVWYAIISCQMSETYGFSLSFFGENGQTLSCSLGAFEFYKNSAGEIFKNKYFGMKL